MLNKLILTIIKIFSVDIEAYSTMGKSHLQMQHQKYNAQLQQRDNYKK